MLKKLIKSLGVKGIFNTIFPKAEKTKLGQAISGFINGATGGTGEILKALIMTTFDTNKDGVVNLDDFKGMTTKTYFMGLGLIAFFCALYYFLGGGSLI